MMYFIPTPIGNLDDISLRGLKLLSEVENIFCEDTRITKKLLLLLAKKHDFNINAKKFISFHSHNETKVLDSLNANDLKNGTFAFVSDAGMPCISDPGASLVRYCQENDIDYEILSGANALLVAYAASGFGESEFSFFGFLPHKGVERKEKLNLALNSQFNAVIYESPHRIELLASELANCDPSRRVFFVKEISKLHEKRYFGNAEEVYEKIKIDNQKGEWVVVVEKSNAKNNASPLLIEDIIALELKPKQKAKLLAKISNENSEVWYKKLINEDLNKKR